MPASGSISSANTSLKNNRRRYEPKYFKKAKGRYDKESIIENNLDYLTSGNKMSAVEFAQRKRKILLKKFFNRFLDVVILLLAVLVALYFVIGIEN